MFTLDFICHSEEPEDEPKIEQSPDTPPAKKRKRIIEELTSEEDDSQDEYVPGGIFFRYFRTIFSLLL